MVDKGRITSWVCEGKTDTYKAWYTVVLIFIKEIPESELGKEAIRIQDQGPQELRGPRYSKC